MLKKTACLVCLSLLCMQAVAQALDDPWENWNRKVFAFNEALDGWVMKPVAKGYQFITPAPVDQGITNAFANLGDVPSAINAGLQAKPAGAGISLLRVLINSTIGFFGVFDVATVIGVTTQREDFGQTLAVWGVPSGNYLMLPLLGPSTIRESVGLGVDVYASPLTHINQGHASYSLWALRIIDTRADLLKAESLINGDRYVFFRTAWWQQRQYLIHDGRLQDDFDSIELDDDDDWLD